MIEAILPFLKRTWPVLVSVALVAALVFSRWQLSNANENLKHEEAFRQIVRTELGAPNAKIETLTVVIHEKLRESRERKDALNRISAETLAAKQRATAADAALKKEQEANAREFAKAQAEIHRLQSRKATGDPVKDAKAMDEDSKAAWKGWK